MQKNWAFAAALLLAGAFIADCGRTCDRPCLIRSMDRYLTALAKNDPSGLEFAEDVKLVENLRRIPIGEGLWKTATGGPAGFKILVADPVAGQVGFWGILSSGGKPALLAARLKVTDGKIAEIDHWISDVSEPLVPGLLKPRPELIEPVPSSERTAREEMLRIAEIYYDAVERNDGKAAPFDGGCERRELGVTSAGIRAPDPAGAEEPPMALFSRLGCGDQPGAGMPGSITKIDRRSLFAADEDMGLVMGFSMFHDSGDPGPLPAGDASGATEMPEGRRAFHFAAVHIFKIRRGRIFEIEAAGIVAPDQADDGRE